MIKTISLLSMPDELLKISLFEALQQPNWRASTWISSDVKEIHLLSMTCQKFRRILLPKIYHTVNLRQLSNEPRLHFLSLTPSYGHLCQYLALRISGTGSNFRIIVEALREHCKYLTNLHTLNLDIQLLDGIKCPEKSLDSNIMGATELRYWKNLCATLPRITELDLNGLTWSDAVKGFAKVDLSSVRTLSLHVPAPQLTMISARFLNCAFTELINISLTQQWCPDPDWVRQAFANRKLQSIAIKGTGANAFSHKHACITGRCSWAASVMLLIRLNSTSLTSLTIGTYMCLMLSLRQIPLTRLITLKLQYVDFRGGAFDDFMKPFLRCPLMHLSLDDCYGVPESFCTWFDPSKASEIWPSLRDLSLSNLRTHCGPGDDEPDETGSNRRGRCHRRGLSDCLYWRSHSRLALQDNCARRGILFDSRNWKWFAGYELGRLEWEHRQ